MKILSGYRTYIIAALIAVTTFAFHVGWLDKDSFEKLVAALGAAGAAFLRMAITAKKT